MTGETNLLLLSNADGTYTDRSATLPQIPDSSHSACVGDINGDGYLDIYVGNVFDAGMVGPYFLMGNGDGSFTQKTSGLPPAIQSLQEKFLSCLFGNVDGDQYPDLVLGTHGDNGYVDSVVLFNDGTGDFTRRPRLVLPQGPLPANNSQVMDIVSLDVNRDGRPDLLLLSTTKAYTGIGLQVLINQGNALVDETARLGPSVARLTGPWRVFIRLADFNGDGLPDFYLDQVGIEDGSPRFWLNNGNGTFTSLASIALPQELGFQPILTVDFDGDRRPDIVKVIGSSGVSISYRSFMNRTVSPDPPAALTATSAGSAVTLAWHAPTSGSPPSSYIIEAGTVPGAANLANFSTGNTLTTFGTGGVPPGTYFVRARATTAQGTSAASNEAQLLVASGCAPGAPGTPAVAFNNGGTVVLTWTAATGAPTGYVLEAGSASGLSNLAVVDVGGVTTLTATGVGNGTSCITREGEKRMRHQRWFRRASASGWELVRSRPGRARHAVGRDQQRRHCCPDVDSGHWSAHRLHPRSRIGVRVVKSRHRRCRKRNHADGDRRGERYVLVRVKARNACGTSAASGELTLVVGTT